jgi:hypothetical protein
MRTRRIAAAVLVTFLSSSVPLAGTAYAQDDPVTVQARARFKEGVDFYDKGQYENARLAFLQAYALKKHPAVLLNLAQSTAKANHPLEAAKYFQQFLKESTTVTPQQKQDAENGLAEVRQKLGRIEVIAPAGTEITLDEKDKIGTTPLAEPIDVDPGSHSLRSPNETVRVTAIAGQKVQARFGGGGAVSVPPPVVAPVSPTPAPTSEPPAPTNATPPANVEGDKPKRTNLLSPPENMTPVYIGLVAGGLGLAGAIVFAAFKSDAQTKADSVASEIRRAAGPNAAGICASTNPADQQRFGEACTTLKQNNDKVDTNAAIANVSLVVMGVGLATAAGWYLFGPKRDDKPAQGEAPAGARAIAPKSPVLTPYAGYGNGGMIVTGEF